MGDPSARNGTTYQYGTYNNTGNGIFYRENTKDCEAYGKRIRAYCDAGDPFCDVGTYYALGTHTKYVQNHGKEIIEYVVEQFKNGGDSGNVSDVESSKNEKNEDHKNIASGLTAMMKLSVALPIISLAIL